MFLQESARNKAAYHVSSRSSQETELETRLPVTEVQGPARKAANKPGLQETELDTATPTTPRKRGVPRPELKWAGCRWGSWGAGQGNYSLLVPSGAWGSQKQGPTIAHGTELT